MKKILALIMAMTMVFALCACGSGSDTAAAPEAAPAEEAAPAPAEEAAPAPAPAEGDDFAEWCAYLKEYAVAGAPSEEEGQAVSAAIDACSTPEEVEAISQLTVLFENVGVLRYDDWIAAGKPAAQAAGIGTEADRQAASGEPTEEPAA